MTQEILVSTDKQAEEVHEKLKNYNRGFMTNLKEYNYHIEEDGEIIAGIVAHSVVDTLSVEYLFVSDAYRKKGLGGKLLAHAEAEAKKNGIKRVLLDTYSFQAPLFYPKHGYLPLCTAEPIFGEYNQYFMYKEL